MMSLHIAVACRNASGMADMPVFTVTVTEGEYDLGIHYDRAEAMAAAEGYASPFISFDHTEQNIILLAVRRLGLLSSAS